MLLYPKCSHGTLKNVLLQSRESHHKRQVKVPSILDFKVFVQDSLYVSTQDLVSMAEQISRGMYHLTRKGFTHRDLAARNIQ